ncbi:hypothetical protein [Methylorubrum extorquens]|uniref:Uncharacterized protein n=1 Tax=Methylorubrum extorquens (strain CM4 / NCIMB 13688) TaxID=440085 RepID=B7L3H2_METC4|nr:hypothetical protein [Methylorubrum extorquens]ACK86380.1 hypothetical protein Mchl_5657 [Methylorubrum extorquens CM4]
MSAHRRFLELRRRHAQEAWLAHVRDPARGRVVAILADWFVGAIDLLPSSIPGQGMADVAAPVRIGDLLRDQGFGTLAASLEAFLSSGRAETDPAPLRAGMALAEALAHAVATRPSEPLVRLAHWLLGLHGTLPHPYSVALTERAQADPRIRFAVRRLLRERVRTFNRDPQRVALCASQAPMARWIDARAETGDDLRGLWEGGLGHDEFRLHDSLHFDCIRRLDARAFMALLHRFAIPGPVANLLQAMSWQRHLGDLASLLRQAPPVRVQTNGMVVRGGLAVLLLGTAARKLQELTRGTDDDGQPLSRLTCAAASETEDAIEALVEAVFSRGDGPELARLWLSRLLKEDTTSNVWNLPLLPLPTPSPDSQGRSIVGVLVQALASRLPQPVFADDELRATDASQRWPCLLASVATAALGAEAEDVCPPGALLARLIQLDLVQTVDIDRFMTNPDGIAADIVRCALRSEPDPSAWFEALWSSKAVALSRERRWRGDDPQAGYDACNAALVAVAVGIVFASPVAQPTGAQQTLFTAVNAAVAGQLLAPTRSDPGLGWHKARRACMALWPHMFAARDAERSRLLADLLRPFARPTETLAWDLVALARAGVSAEDIGSALRSLGHDPAALIDVILSDRARRGEGSRVTWHETHDLEALGRAVARR